MGAASLTSETSFLLVPPPPPLPPSCPSPSPSFPCSPPPIRLATADVDALHLVHP